MQEEWSPVRVLTPHFQFEGLASRPLDERAYMAAGSSVDLDTASFKGSLACRGPGIKLAAGVSVDLTAARFRALPVHRDPRIKLVPTLRNRTEVGGLQDRCPATERCRRIWGDARVLAPILRLHRATCPLVH